MAGRDVSILFPTGGVASLCFRLPAMLREHSIMLVVCPLTSLMIEQCADLNSRGGRAMCLHSAQSSAANLVVLGHLRACGPAGPRPTLDIVYMTAEGVRDGRVLDALARLVAQLLRSLIAVDKAHCISTWRFDFRPAYRGLGELRQRLFWDAAATAAPVPMMALSAIASLVVRADILQTLGLQESALVITTSFDREELFYCVRMKHGLPGYADAFDDMTNRLRYEVRLRPGIPADRRSNGIVYCATRASRL